MTQAQELKNLQRQFVRMSDADLALAEILIKRGKYSSEFKAEIHSLLKTIWFQRQQGA
ncbi:hypothetical protein [Armatimonas sp.]|uniref:hypothetical protein n=1 Tax=Armatimonas sp. TaxID=1872638 RepID=UPI00374DC5C5